MARGSPQTGTVAFFRLLSPPVFSGTESSSAADYWIRKTESLLQAAEIPDDLTVTAARLQLEGLARVWWDQSVEDHPTDGTWTDFRERFSAWFVRAPLERARRTLFFSLVQGQMTVRQYRVEFERHSRACGVPLTDEFLQGRFVRGLRLELQLRLVVHQEETFRQTVELAERYETEVEVAEPVQPTPVVGQKRALDTSAETRESVGGQRSQSQTSPVQSSPVQPRAPGFCFHCRKIGHRQFECRTYLRRCFRCGLSGHRVRECPHPQTTAPVPLQTLPPPPGWTRQGSTSAETVPSRPGRSPLPSQREQFDSANVRGV